MRKKLLFLTTATIMSLCAWADTPEEAFERHPDAFLSEFFYPDKEVAVDTPPFGIESVFFVRPLKVYIKTEVGERELVKHIKQKIDGPEGTYVYALEGGDTIAFAGDYFFYFFEDGSMLKCLIDYDKGDKFREMRLSK